MMNLSAARSRRKAERSSSARDEPRSISGARTNTPFTSGSLAAELSRSRTSTKDTSLNAALRASAAGWSGHDRRRSTSITAFGTRCGSPEGRKDISSISGIRTKNTTSAARPPRKVRRKVRMQVSRPSASLSRKCTRSSPP